VSVAAARVAADGRVGVAQRVGATAEDLAVGSEDLVRHRGHADQFLDGVEERRHGVGGQPGHAAQRPLVQHPVGGAEAGAAVDHGGAADGAAHGQRDHRRAHGGGEALVAVGAEQSLHGKAVAHPLAGDHTALFDDGHAQPGMHQLRRGQCAARARAHHHHVAVDVLVAQVGPLRHQQRRRRRHLRPVHRQRRRAVVAEPLAHLRRRRVGDGHQGVQPGEGVAAQAVAGVVAGGGPALALVRRQTREGTRPRRQQRGQRVSADHGPNQPSRGPREAGQPVLDALRHLHVEGALGDGAAGGDDGVGDGAELAALEAGEHAHRRPTSACAVPSSRHDRSVVQCPDQRSSTISAEARSLLVHTQLSPSGSV